MFLELVKKRRSIRRFKNKDVEKEKIDKIVQSVLMSPSSRNIRPWKFIIVRNSEMLEKLSKSKEHGSSFLKNANLGIVVFSDKDKSDVCVEDASIASIYVQLAAESIGLGSCWIQIRKREHDENLMAEEYVSKLLNIPSNHEVESIIAIGYPDEERKPYNIKDLDYSKIYEETYK